MRAMEDKEPLTGQEITAGLIDGSVRWDMATHTHVRVQAAPGEPVSTATDGTTGSTDEPEGVPPR